MTSELLTIPLRNERDVVQARQRSRELAALLGFDNQDQIRLATATSEMARNAFRYAKEGRVSFLVELDAPQQFKIEVTDSGPGIKNLESVLGGHYQSKTGLGMGIIGTRRLMDAFEVQTSSASTTVRMGKFLSATSASVTPLTLRKIEQRLKSRPPESPYEEIDRQNQELLKTLQALKQRQEDLSLLNHELEDTNRGVVALYAELDERTDYLRRASELKTSFLSNVSHEFRTPLNAIISLAGLLLERMDGDLTPDQETQVRFIESSARTLQDMVNDLLDVAKVEAGKVRIRVKSFTVLELFSGLKGMLKPLLAHNTSVQLAFDVGELTPMRTDDGKVSQILRNFISNAIKFTPQGVITVSAHATDRQTVIFEVKDTGIGIAEEHHETIFKEFSQIDNPLQDRYRGTGLGLPLCRTFARLLGGSVWLTSAPGQGSTFFAEIPVHYIGEAVTIDTELPAPEFHRPPVLLVAEDPEWASSIEEYFRDSEFQLIVVTSVARASAWIERHKPVAILADLYIDDGTLMDFIGEVERSSESIPVIAMRVRAEGPRAVPEGVSAFLSKPVSRQTLLREVRRVTHRSRPSTVLLVDDNEVSRYILRELLDRPWLNLIEAKNGAEALKLVDENMPDAMILDLLMPDVSGWDVLRELRSRPATADLPIFIYTSKTLSPEEEAELQKVCSGIIRKDEISSRLSADSFLSKLADHGIREPVSINA